MPMCLASGVIRGVMMSKLERVIAAGSVEMPDCRCGTEMKLVRSCDHSLETETRVYQCPACGHELRLMAWRDSTVEIAPQTTSGM